MMECDEIIEKLEKFKKEIREEIREREPGLTNIMTNIVEISSKYPDQKGIIELIVLMEDYMVRDNRKSQDRLIHIMDTIVDYKIYTLRNIRKIKTKQDKKSKIKSLFETIISAPLFFKIAAIFLFVTILFVTYIFFPKKTDKFITKEIPTITKTYKGMK